MPIPKTGGETKGGRQVEYRSHFNFSIKWWFHPLWEPGDTAQATRVAKKCFLATIRALQKEVGAPYFGAQNCTAVCIRLLLRPCYSSTGAPAVPVGTSTTVPVPRTGLNLVHVLDYCTKFSTKFKIVLQSTGTQRIHVLVAEPASYAWSYAWSYARAQPNRARLERAQSNDLQSCCAELRTRGTA